MNEQDAIEQLADLLEGSSSVQDAPASLAALLSLADTVRDQATLIAPSDDFRAALRAELVAAAPESLVDRTRAAWQRRVAGLRASTRVAVATMTASGMIGSAGVAVAAQEALPGDLLYPVKSMTEQTRLLLAVDDITEARLHLLFAAERLQELRATAGELSADEMVALLERMDESARRGAEVLIDGAAAGAVDLAELRDFIELQEAELSALVRDLPLLVRPVAQDSLELLRRISITAVGIVPTSDGRVVEDCDCDAPTALGSPEQADSFSRTGQGSRTGAPVGEGTTIALPGEGPAVPLPDCDCVTLPGGPATREPTNPGAEDPDTGSRDEDEDEEPPFEGEGPITGGELQDDGDDGETGTFSNGVSQLPAEDLVTPIEDTTGATVDTGPVDRSAQAVDELLVP